MKPAAGLLCCVWKLEGVMFVDFRLFRLRQGQMFAFLAILGLNIVLRSPVFPRLRNLCAFCGFRSACTSLPRRGVRRLLRRTGHHLRRTQSAVPALLELGLENQ